MPYMVSGIGIGMILMMLFSKDTGSLNLLLLSLGIVDRPVDITEPSVSTWALPLMVGWRYAGFNMALFLSGLLAIPTETIEAAIVDGASYAQKLTRIYLPQMVPSITAATVFCLIGSFGIFDEAVGVGGMTGNESAEFLSIVIFRHGFSENSNLAQVITMSMTVYIPLMLVAFLLTRLQKRLRY
jgi:ABC-type sugar transport system permease subunit